MSKDNNQSKHHFFVSYTYWKQEERGVGEFEIIRDNPIHNSKDVRGIGEYINEKMGNDRVIITNIIPFPIVGTVSTPTPAKEEPLLEDQLCDNIFKTWIKEWIK